MKQKIEQLIAAALQRLIAQGRLPENIQSGIQISHSKDTQHGDFASNIAMLLAKTAGVTPRALAEEICAALPANEAIAKIEIAGPGFINFFIKQSASHQIIPRILEEASEFGRSNIGAGQYVQVEFVSANPTGPLHVGHGRGAAFGEALADLLAAAGFKVEREYYVNDAGRQMNILAVSVWLRYLQAHNIQITFPVNGYRGDYIQPIAADLKQQYRERFVKDPSAIMRELPPDETLGGDKEDHIDGLIARCRELLGESDYHLLFDYGLRAILDDIRDDLSTFGIDYENWFSERSLETSGALHSCIKKLQAAGHLYTQEGALWFRSSAFGDEKDRVVQRDNGQTTYFASDIAYYQNKIERGYDHIIYVWGADHHGYIPRLRAVATALGGDPSKLEVLLVQFANLYRGQQKISMSTRAGEFVTLRELRDEVGRDAARFFYIMRRSEQHMDFDLELAKSQSNDNPVYYVQYAHARIASVFKQLLDSGLTHDNENGLRQLARLQQPHEEKLIKTLTRYPELIEKAALAREPHQLTYYMRELANDFHSYYNAHTFIVEDTDLRDARLCLVKATQQTLRNALQLIGVSAPDKM